jgi:large subunit ribosomal protein L7/L12
MSEEKTITLSKGTEELLSKIEKLTALELSELVKAIEDKFGVSAAPAAGMMMAAAPSGDSSAAEAVDEKSHFDVILSSAGDKKIEVIKAVREITGLGLAESKALVDSAPATVKEKMAKDEAAEAKAKLEAVGAGVELK